MTFSPKTEELINELGGQGQGWQLLSKPALPLFIWLVLSIVYAGGLLAFLGLREDLMVRLESAVFLLDLGLAALTALSAAYGAAMLAYPDARGKKWAGYAPLVPFGLLILLNLFTAMGIISPLTPLEGAKEYANIAAHCACITFIGLVAFVPGLFIFYALRHAATVHYYWVGALAALAVTSVGYIAVRLEEQSDDVMHLLIYHVLPLVASCGIGMWLGQKVLKW